MANRLGSFIKKKYIGKNRNLVSLDEPYEVMARLLKGRQVTGIIDAGASDGRISRRLLRMFPAAQVYAFEPNPLYSETLEQCAKEDPRLNPQFLALSDSEGQATLHVTTSPGVASLFKSGKRLNEIEPEGASVKSEEKVELVTIDKWAERNGDLAIQLIKMDIQAGELKALQGAVRTLGNSTLVVYAEVFFNPVYEGGAIYSEIDLFFREHGFALYDMFKPRYGDNGLIMWANAIFINTERLGI